MSTVASGKLFPVQVPAGVGSGGRVQVTAPSGATLEAEVPPGLAAGAIFHIADPGQAAPTALVTTDQSAKESVPNATQQEHQAVEVTKDGSKETGTNSEPLGLKKSPLVLSQKDKKSEPRERWCLFWWHLFLPTWIFRQTDSSWKNTQDKMSNEFSCMAICAALLMSMTYTGATTPVDMFSRLMYECEHHIPGCNHKDPGTIQSKREHASVVTEALMQESCVGFVLGLIALAMSIYLMIAVGKISTLETMHIFKEGPYKCVLIPLICIAIGLQRLITAIYISFTTVYPTTACVGICFLLIAILWGIGCFKITMGVTDVDLYHRSQVGEHKKQNIRAAGGATMTTVDVAEAFQHYLDSVSRDVWLVDSEEFTEWISTEALRRHPKEKHANTYTKEFARKLSGDYVAKVMKEDVAKCLEAIESPEHRLTKGSTSESRVSLIKPANTSAEQIHLEMTQEVKV